MKNKWTKTRKTLLQQSKHMSSDLKKALTGKTIKDVSVKKFEFGEVHIRFVTDKDTVVVGATDLGVWVAHEILGDEKL